MEGKWGGRGGEQESGRHLPKDAGGGGCDKGKKILIKLSLLQTQLLSEFFACLPSPLSKFSRSVFEGL